MANFHPTSKKPSDIGRASDKPRRPYPSTRRPSEAGRARGKPVGERPLRRTAKNRITYLGVRPRQFIRFGWRKRRPGWGDRMVLAFDLFVASVIFWCLWAAMVTYHHFEQDLPPLAFLKQEYRPATVSWFVSGDGRVIGEFAEEYRLVIPYNQIPRHVVLAFVAAEDANFFGHPGVDLPGVVRAFVRNLEAGRIVQGGSTITQQITRSFILSRERSYRRKVREAMLAWRLEKNLNKREILFLYLNQIYLGEGAYGVEGAARTYFGKTARDLTLAEAAVLAGLVQAPSRYTPLRNPKAARTRQKYVLGQMVKSRFIKPEQAEEALGEKILFRERPDWNRYVVPEFTELVRREVESLVGRKRLMKGGLRVFTTVDLDVQAKAHKALMVGLSELTRRHSGYRGPKRRIRKTEWEPFLREQAQSFAVRPLTANRFTDAVVLAVDTGKGDLRVQAGRYEGRIVKDQLAWALEGRGLASRFAPGDVLQVRYLGRDPETGVHDFSLEPTMDVQGALVCLETGTGEVKAMIGGRDFGESQFNRAVQARRQPGSSFKPFVYAAALETGFTPADVVWDEPVEYEYEGGEIYSPQNYDHNFDGPTTLYMGLVRSRNVVAVRLLDMIGIDRVIHTARRMGVTSKLAPYQSLALGSSEVTLLEIVSAYSTIANQGTHVAPRYIKRIEDRDGRVIVDFPPRSVQAVSTGTAFQLLDMMKGVVERGTGARVAALKRPVAGKTGTTNDLADAWFIGFTPEYTAGVWVGYDQRKELGKKESGGRAAAPIFLYFMKDLLDGRPVREFKPPPGVVFAEVDPATGWLADEYTPSRITVCFKEDQIGQSGYSEYEPDPFQGPIGPPVNVMVQDGRIVIYEDDGSYPDPSEPAWEPGAEPPYHTEEPPDDPFDEPDPGDPRHGVFLEPDEPAYEIEPDPSRPADEPDTPPSDEPAYFIEP